MGQKKDRKKYRLFSLLLVMVMALGSVFMSPVHADEVLAGETAVAAGSEPKVTDANSAEMWTQTTGDDTKNLGRIWTDKTVTDSSVTFSNADSQGNPITEEVKGDEDFLASLSLLSSYANIKGTVTVSTPLDIVMVLDTSGSMNDSIEVSHRYINAGFNSDTTFGDIVGSISWWQTFYYHDPETREYYKLQYSRQGFINTTYEFYYEKNGQRITVARGTRDEAFGPSAVNIYKRSSDTKTKMQALIDATKKFVHNMDAENAGIPDANKDRLGIVSFASGSKVVSEFSSDATKLNDLLGRLYAEGATAADYGFQAAKNMFDRSARPNAKKVLIFFTDGNPNHGNGFESSVANSSIRTAKAMKSNGVDIYSVGVFEEADPEVTNDKFNAYMNGVSSNYPLAESYSKLGNRVENGNYYMAAVDAEGLNGIFDAIQQQITQSDAQFPTIQEGKDPSKTGYVTFTDTLGDYMEITDVHSIVLGNTMYVEHSVTDDQNGTVSYSFTGKGVGNDLDANHRAELRDILITVTKAVTTGTSDQVHGDVIEVKIPSSLIPLRGYDVDIVDGKATTTVTAEFPMRISYGIKKTAGLDVLMQQPDDAMNDYISRNLNADGTVNFYANDFVRNGANGGANVNASFTPALTNTFYYFTEDTPLYTDETLSVPVTGTVDDNTTYYYKNIYYAAGRGLDPLVEALPIHGSDIRTLTTTDPNGVVMVKAGSPNNTTLTRYEKAKEVNTTETASYVTKPTWQPQPEGTYGVKVFLGNNGRLQRQIPGINIPVHLQVGLLGRTPDRTESFTFTASLKDASQAEHVSLPEPSVLTVQGDANVTSGDMGDLLIKEAGTYEIEIRQTRGDAADIDYDTHTAILTVTVSRAENNVLRLDSAVYSNANAWNAGDVALQDKAAFTNYISGSFAFTKFGDKNGSNERDDVLKGAKFALYELTCTDETHDHSAEKVKVTKRDGEVIDTPNDCWRFVETVTSSDAGLVRFDRMHTTGQYRLVEVEQPSGYVLPSGQWNITYKADPNHPEQMIFQPGESVGNPPAFKVMQNAAGTTEYQVKNYKWYDMPVSGNSGITKYLMAGAGMMLGGVLLYVGMNRRHKKA